MKLDVKFQGIEETFDVKFTESEQALHTDFKNVVVVERTDIPPEYGLITYDQNRTITVS